MLTQPSKTKETTSHPDLLVGRRLVDTQAAVALADTQAAVGLADTQAAVGLADMLVVDTAGCRKWVELAVHAQLASHS